MKLLLSPSQLRNLSPTAKYARLLLALLQYSPLTCLREFILCSSPIYYRTPLGSELTPTA